MYHFESGSFDCDCTLSEGLQVRKVTQSDFFLLAFAVSTQGMPGVDKCRKTIF